MTTATSQPLHVQATFMVLDVLHRHGVVEVRIPRTPKGTVSGYFDDHSDLIRAVAPWNGRASIYVTINELVPDVLARAQNRLKHFTSVTTAAEDVRRRLWFCIDVDAVRPRGIPSTDAEMAHALTRRDEVIAYLSDHGHFPAPLRTLSGNAGWGLWSVDLANSAEITALYQAALAVLDERFSDQKAKVDPSVAQPAQLMKLPMTIAVTGDEIPGRPHRRAQIQCPVPEHLLDPTQADLVTLDQLRWLAAQGSPRRTYSLSLASKGLDPVTVLKARGLYLRELPDARHAVICPWAGEHSVDHGPNDTSTVLFEPSDGRGWGFRCLHAHCAERTIGDVFRQLGIGAPDSLLSPKGDFEKERIFDPKSLSDLLTDRTPTITWVLQSYLPEGGLILLAAFPKVGKSTFAYHLAIAVARGEDFLGFATRQGAVLILAVEEHPRDVKVRLLKLGARPEEPIHVHVGPVDPNARTFSALREFVRKEHIRLVVLDTLAQFWQISDENDNAQVLQRITPFLTLARETSAAVLLIYHERKMHGDGGRAIRGGSALLGAVDQALLLDHRQGGNSCQRILRSVGRYDDTPSQLILEQIGFTYRALGTPDEIGLAAAAEAVTDALSSGAHTIKTLVEKTGLTDKQVRTALESLGDAVVRSGAGRKGDPFTYKRPPGNAIHSEAQPKGKKPKPQRPDTSR